MWILDDRTVRNLRRNQDDISVLEQIGTLSDLHTDVPFQEKIKLIIIVGMRPHLCHPAIAVIIKFKILRQHVLARDKSAL